MSAKRTLTVHLVTGGVRHRWCDACQTSAGFEVDIFAVSDHGVAKVKTVHGCDRCDRAR